MDTEKELELEEGEMYKEFWVGVRYYSGNVPYASMYDAREHVGDCDVVYKIRIPYKNLSSDKE